jgi:hypothetical protein
VAERYVGHGAVACPRALVAIDLLAEIVDPMVICKSTIQGEFYGWATGQAYALADESVWQLCENARSKQQLSKNTPQAAVLARRLPRW